MVIFAVTFAMLLKINKVVIKSISNKTLVDEILVNINQTCILQSYTIVANKWLPTGGWHMLWTWKVLVRIIEYDNYATRDTNVKVTIEIYGTKSNIKKLTEYMDKNEKKDEENDGEKDDSPTYTLITVDDTKAYRVSYNKTKQEGNKFITQQQKELVTYISNKMQNLKSNYKKTAIVPQLSILIYGIAGGGKTTIGSLLATKLNGSLVKIDPTVPGISIDEIYNQFGCSLNKPLIVLIDEYDTIIDKIKQPLKTEAKELNALVRDKQSLNKFMDSIKDYPGIVLIATSNQNKQYFEHEDNLCYVRDGRIDIEDEIHPLELNELIDVIRQITRAYNFNMQDTNRFIQYVNNSLKKITIASIIHNFKMHHDQGVEFIIKKIEK